MATILAIIQLCLIAIAFGLCGFLFVSLKRELQLAGQRAQAVHENLAERIGALEKQLAEVRKEVETAAEPQPPVAVPSTSINLNKRSQALKMVRLGEGPEHIAAALSMPRKEVELLIKVQRMLLDSNGLPTS